VDTTLPGSRGPNAALVKGKQAITEEGNTPASYFVDNSEITPSVTERLRFLFFLHNHYFYTFKFVDVFT